MCCIGVVLWTLPAGIISAGLTSIDEKRQARKQLYGPAARFILAWWRLQHVNKRIRSMRSKDNHKERCKQVIAYLHCARLCREFQHHRYGTHQDYDTQLRRDINQILHQLQIIENKLNNTSENLHIEQ